MVTEYFPPYCFFSEAKSFFTPSLQYPAWAVAQVAFTPKVRKN